MRSERWSLETRVAIWSGAGAGLLGVAGLVGWWFAIPALIRIASGYKAIAPSVSIALIVLGLIVPWAAGGHLAARARALLAAVVGLISLFGLLELIGFAVGADLNLEDALTAYLAKALSIPFETMSPVAGALLFLLGAAMLALLLGPRADARRRLGDIAGALAVVAGTIAVIFTLGYAYGAPLLYGGPAIPISLTATLGGVLLATGVVAAAGRESWPLRNVSGGSARARLLRAFVPFTVFVALAVSVAEHRLSALAGPGHLLVGAALAVVFASAVGMAALQIARSIGETIDQARLARQRAEDALRESQADLNRAQAVARTGSWRLDVRRNELLWSEETHRMFGVPEGTPMTYETFLAAVHPDDRQYVDAQWAAALRGEDYDIEHRIVVGDEVKWVRERAGLEFDAGGAVLGGFGTVQDITERKRAEQQIVHRNAVLQAINRVFDWALRCRTEEELGKACLSVAEDLTQSRFGFIGEIRPEGALMDLAISDPGWAACAAYDQTGQRRPPGHFPIHGIYGRVLADRKGFFTNDPTTHPDRIGLPAGHPPLSSFLGVPLMSGERVFGIMAVANRPGGYTDEELRALEALAPAVVESLQRKRAEEERERLLGEINRQHALLETIVENSRGQLVYLDRDFNFVWVNPAYAEVCRRSRDDFAGHNHFEFYPHEENEAIFRRVRDTGEPVEFREKPFVFPDMPERGVTYWDWTLTPVKDDQGEVQGLVFSLVEMTEQVRAREQIAEGERERARVAETVAAEINHRMKNNLMLVSGILQLQLSAQPQGGPAADALRQAISRISALSVVHEQLYEDRSGKVELQYALRRIGEMAAGALSPGNVELSVAGDRVPVHSRVGSAVSVVANELITNAIKYGAAQSDGALHVDIDLSLRDGNLILRIWNSGNPVPADFDVGAQRGMGLQIAREVATRQLKGSFALRPHDDGTISEIVIDQAVLDGGEPTA